MPGCSSSRSDRFCAPDSTISRWVITSVATGASPSGRSVREPVTTMVSTACTASLSRAGAGGSASAAPACREARAQPSTTVSDKPRRRCPLRAEQRRSGRRFGMGSLRRASRLRSAQGRRDDAGSGGLSSTRRTRGRSSSSRARPTSTRSLAAGVFIRAALSAG